MGTIVNALARVYQSRLLNPVIVEFPDATTFSKRIQDLANLTDMGSLSLFGGPAGLREAALPRDRFLARFQNPLVTFKLLQGLNMAALPLDRHSIDEVAQWTGTRIYPDRMQSILQFSVMPPEGIYKTKKGLNFTTTSWTKKMLGLDEANRIGWTGEGMTVAIPDSFPGYSPVIIKDSNKEIDILPLEDLYQCPITEGLRVFTRIKDKGDWAAIKAIYRHPYSGKLIRLNATGGLVDASPNHSIFIDSKQMETAVINGHNCFMVGSSLRNAEEIEVGELLSMPRIENARQERTCFIGTEDLAWFYGFFAAEGSASLHKCEWGFKRDIKVSNQKIRLIQKSVKIMLQHFHRKAHIWKSKKDNTYQATITSPLLFQFFRQNFYTSSGLKRVPKLILNAPKNIQMAFLKGYNAGDGKQAKRHSGVFQQFTTNSQTLALGLIWLTRRLTHQSFSIQTRDDKPSIVEITWNQNEENLIADRRELRKKRTMEYEGWLYDITTDQGDQSFVTGIGVRCHNTGGRNTHPQTRNMEYHSTMKDKGQFIDKNGHGQWCCSTVGGSKVVEPTYNVEMEGMAPNCKLVGIKCLGFIMGIGFESDIIQAIDLSLSRQADIVSMSLGSEEIPDSPDDDAECVAIRKARNLGLIFCVAAGNSGPNNQTINTPGCSPDVLTVGAWDELAGNVAEFSSRGPVTWADSSTLIKPDVIAPGVNIYSGCLGLLDTQGDQMQNKYAILSGTSMATPHIAGLLACVKQYYKKSYGKTLTLDLIKTICEAQGQLKDNYQGWGLITFQWFKDYALANWA